MRILVTRRKLTDSMTLEHGCFEVPVVDEIDNITGFNITEEGRLDVYSMFPNEGNGYAESVHGIRTAYAAGRWDKVARVE